MPFIIKALFSKARQKLPPLLRIYAPTYWSFIQSKAQTGTSHTCQSPYKMYTTLNKGCPVYCPYCSFVCALAKDPDITQNKPGHLRSGCQVFGCSAIPQIVNHSFGSLPNMHSRSRKDIYYGNHIMTLPIFHVNIVHSASLAALRCFPSRGSTSRVTMSSTSVITVWKAFKQTTTKTNQKKKKQRGTTSAWYNICSEKKKKKKEEKTNYMLAGSWNSVWLSFLNKKILTLFM